MRIGLSKIGSILSRGCLIGLFTLSSGVNAKEQAFSSESLLQPYSASYTASISGVPFGGSASRTLTHNDDGSWTLEFNASATLFKMEESSTFFVQNGDVISRQYSTERPGILGNRPLEVANFDWKDGKVNWQKEDKKWSTELPEGTIDNLAYQIQLRLDLEAGKREGLNYLIADDDGVYHRDFVVEGDEILETKAGKLDTVRIKIKRKSDKRATWIWLAKNWGYILVKFKQTEDDKEYVIAFEDATVNGEPISSKYQKK